MKTSLAAAMASLLVLSFTQLAHADIDNGKVSDDEIKLLVEWVLAL